MILEDDYHDRAGCGDGRMTRIPCCFKSRPVTQKFIPNVREPLQMCKVSRPYDVLLDSLTSTAIGHGTPLRWVSGA